MISGGRLAQADLEMRAEAAIAKYQALYKRATLLSDDTARAGIMAWIGDPNIPGSPADRFKSVQDDETQHALWGANRIEHLTDLESVNTTFDGKVSSAEKGGTLFGGPKPIVDDQGNLTPVGIGLLVVGIGGLVGSCFLG